jgi:hypothetical protein
LDNEPRLDDVRISFKEYFKLLVEKETGVIAEQIKAMEKALILRTSDLEEHLERLNGAHQKSQEDRSRYVDRMVFDPWRDDVNKALTEMRGSWRWVAAIASFISSVVVGFILLLARSVLHS